MIEARTCVDCPADIGGRPKSAYLCSRCAARRQAAARKAYYEEHKRGRDRYTGTVGTLVLCPCGEERFIKMSGSHKYGPLCQAASKDFHRTAWNARRVAA